MKEICGVCNITQHKYKCPTCLLKYCSATCFKTHKESKCTKSVITANKDEKSKSTESVPLTDGGNTEDRISTHLLERLDENEAICKMLENPHLRNMLTQLDKSANPQKSIDVSMKEPIFLELVDECLKVVEPDNVAET